MLSAFIGFSLILSGTGKALDPGGTRRAVAQYGLPSGVSRAAALALTLAELVVGSTLVLGFLPLFSSAAAMVLFLAFVVAVSRVLRRGTVMDCHCFGTLTRERAGATTLARLGLFVALTLVVLSRSLISGPQLLAAYALPARPSYWLAALVTGSVAATCLMLLGQMKATLQALRGG